MGTNQKLITLHARPAPPAFAARNTSDKARCCLLYHACSLVAIPRPRVVPPDAPYVMARPAPLVYLHYVSSRSPQVTMRPGDLHASGFRGRRTHGAGGVCREHTPTPDNQCLPAPLPFEGRVQRVRSVLYQPLHLVDVARESIQRLLHRLRRGEIDARLAQQVDAVLRRARGEEAQVAPGGWLPIAASARQEPPKTPMSRRNCRRPAASPATSPAPPASTRGAQGRAWSCLWRR